MRRDDQRQAVKNIPLEQLKPFKNHPFQVRDDEEFRRLVESIEIHGVIHPAVARQIGEDCYELISGHRRKAACEVLGYSEMPVLVRSMTDDEAVVNMVDANLQRETILPSERAFAYKMKLVAMSHQGRKGFTSAQLGRKCVGKESRELIAEQVGQSRNQISRYIRLTELIPEILEMVDNRKMALNPAVSISYLDKKQQRLLYKVMVALKATPSISQAKAIREKASESDFTEDYLVCILSEKKPNQREPMIVEEEEIKQYFPSHYNSEQIKKYGVLVPAIARPLPDGSYELVAGHRRRRASELAGKETMPVIVRDLDDDAATIIMVDSNLQRENLLPSERAFAYKMKLEAIKHQGARTDLTSVQVEQKLSARDQVAKEAGERSGIDAACMKAECKDFIADAAPRQVLICFEIITARRWCKPAVLFPDYRRRGKKRRVRADDLHRTDKIIPLYFYEVLHRCCPSYALAVPIPFPIAAHLQAVMIAVRMLCAPYTFEPFRLMTQQESQRVHRLGRSDLFFRYIWLHSFHLLLLMSVYIQKVQSKT